MSVYVDSVEVLVEDEEFGESFTVHIKLSELGPALRRIGVPSMWWCNVLHLGYREDGTAAARAGLPKYCRDEGHGLQCGWYLLLSDWQAGK